jgi:hypothetical protein
VRAGHQPRDSQLGLRNYDNQLTGKLDETSWMSLSGQTTHELGVQPRDNWMSHRVEIQACGQSLLTARVFGKLVAHGNDRDFRRF